MADGLDFVKAAAADPTSTPSPETAARPDSSPAATVLPPPPSTPEATPAGSAPELSPLPPSGGDDGDDDQTGWGEAFGPPYSAIFVDVDNKDTSMGMSCPPAAFLESSFLGSLRALLHGGGGGGGGSGGHGSGGGPGVLAINVAARSKELFDGALEAVCAAFPGGEVGGGTDRRWLGWYKNMLFFGSISVSSSGWVGVRYSALLCCCAAVCC